MEDKEMAKEVLFRDELALMDVPKAVQYLVAEMAEMRAMMEHIESQLGLGVDKHRPIGYERASEMLGLTVNVLKKMVRNREIPHYDKGRTVYFFEDELIKWVEKSRVKTYSEEWESRRRR